MVFPFLNKKMDKVKLQQCVNSAAQAHIATAFLGAIAESGLPLCLFKYGKSLLQTYGNHVLLIEYQRLRIFLEVRVVRVICHVSHRSFQRFMAISVCFGGRVDHVGPCKKTAVFGYKVSYGRLDKFLI